MCKRATLITLESFKSLGLKGGGIVTEHPVTVVSVTTGTTEPSLADHLLERVSRSVSSEAILRMTVVFFRCRGAPRTLTRRTSLGEPKRGVALTQK